MARDGHFNVAQSTAAPRGAPLLFLGIDALRLGVGPPASSRAPGLDEARRLEHAFHWDFALPSARGVGPLASSRRLPTLPSSFPRPDSIMPFHLLTSCFPEFGLVVARRCPRPWKRSRARRWRVALLRVGTGRELPGTRDCRHSKSLRGRSAKGRRNARHASLGAYCARSTTALSDGTGNEVGFGTPPKTAVRDRRNGRLLDAAAQQRRPGPGPSNGSFCRDRPSNVERPFRDPEPSLAGAAYKNFGRDRLICAANSAIPNVRLLTGATHLWSSVTGRSTSDCAKAASLGQALSGLICQSCRSEKLHSHPACRWQHKAPGSISSVGRSLIGKSQPKTSASEPATQFGT